MVGASHGGSASGRGRMTDMSERPNIIVLMADQWRGDCLSVEGSGQPVLTPNLDGLAADGARFSRAYSTCPVCMPARRSLMSGQHPATHGLLANKGGLEWDITDTLPGVLREAGYQTHLAGRDMHQFPTRKRFGFDEMVTYHDYLPWVARRLPVDTEYSPALGAGVSTGITANDWTARTWPHDEDLHLTNWTVTQARGFLRRRDPTCPFFLVVSFLAPHPPLVPPAFYFDRYLRMEMPDPAIGAWDTPPEGPPTPAGIAVHLEGELRRTCQAAYYGMINHIDDQIRRLIYLWHGIPGFDLDNTIVVFTSDHGEMLGDHYRWRKSLPYEGSSRIPMIIRAPRRFGFARGAVIDQVVCLEDLMPTLLDLAGVDIPHGVDGRSLVPLLRGDFDGWRSAVHIEHAGHPDGVIDYRVPGFHSLTDGGEKYVWFSDDGRDQLFDLEADPRELVDLAGDPAVAERLEVWRERLVAELEGRPEGFVRGGRLVPGRPHVPVMAHA